MDTLNSIKNYIIFLKDKLNLSVSLHPISYDPILYSNELISFNIHTNSYCTHIKTNKTAFKRCLASQKKVFEKCKSGSFCGTCYAGVKEFVYPLTNGKECIAFISVSGYKTERYEEIQHKIAKEFGFELKTLKKNYNLLKETPSKEYVDTLIKPLCDMLELAYLKSEDMHKKTCFAEEVANFLRERRTQNISSEDICYRFNCSRSYMSTQFNKYYNKTIPEYITELRMEDAKGLLRCSTLNITEIAFSVGFFDSNYFSNLFKKLNGITPSAYRKNNQN